MKVFRTVISSLLIGSALLSFTACAPKHDLSPKALADYMDNQGAEESDSAFEFYNTAINYGSGDYLYYVYGDTEDFDGFESLIGYNERADEITHCMQQEGEVHAYIWSLSFDQNDANDFYHEQKDYYEIVYSDENVVIVTESPNLEYILYAESESDYTAIYHDCSTNSVLCLDVHGGDEEDTQELVDEFCKDFGVVSPTTLLNDE